MKEKEEIITLWPSTCPHDICGFETSQCSCDWDGLACKSYNSLGPVTFYGCVGAQRIVVGEIDAEGENTVYTPDQEGGPFVNTEGNPFLKIYFPENNTAIMKSWEADIVVGQDSNIDSYNTCPCADSHCACSASPRLTLASQPACQGCTSIDPIDPCSSFGKIYISDVKVTIHGGGWVQMWMDNDGIDFESISHGIIKGRWGP